jgi:cell wall-associated NlpC family hydrolase
MSDLLSQEQKQAIRNGLIDSAHKLLGVRYDFGAEWKNHSVIPEALDCSELVEGVYALQRLQPAMPDGSQNQFTFTIQTSKPLPGDLAFFGRGANPHQIYHVGMVYDSVYMIEARGLDLKASFKTGEVILRPIKRWEAYKNFMGFRAHPKLV